MKMFCYQCQEAAKNTGCEISGVCGKTPKLATNLDVLKYSLKGLSLVAEKSKFEGNDVSVADHFIMESLFKLITNANFDDEVIMETIKESVNIRENLKAGLNSFKDSAFTNFGITSIDDILALSDTASVLSEQDENIRSAKEIVITGLMGAAAYHSHANRLGYNSQLVFDETRRILAFMLDDSKDLNDYIAVIDQVGAVGLEVMKTLDEANTSSYGNPEISSVKIGVGTRPGILVSGHDLKDIETLLEQSKESGVDIYTHSEMLPAHYYPELKKYSHLYGNYGNAWWDQVETFETFNGPILFTTNCLVPPKKTATYNDRVFTTGNTGMKEWKHISADKDGNKDFTEIIELAKKCAAPTEIEQGVIIGGFAHNQVLELADKVVDAVKGGAISKFVVMAGCDGRQGSRNYYTEFAKQLPKDTVILTAGCAKYKYNKLDLGDIAGIPRVLDAGQCNDSYSLAVIALKLAEVFGCGVNDLPIYYNIAWYEQKAVTVLLTLLHLGVQNIHIGPTLPAFLSKDVAEFLINTFKLGTISTVEEDIKNNF